MNWDLITNIILGTALMALAVFAGLGLYQWVTRKSLKKVDLTLRAMFIPLILMVIIYFVFDKILVLNTRPDGSGEASFPSTHVMVVATIFGTLMFALPKYVASKNLRRVLDVVMVILIVLVAVGRVLANKHWPSDIVGGIVFAGILTTIYYIFSREPENELDVAKKRELKEAPSNGNQTEQATVKKKGVK